MFFERTGLRVFVYKAEIDMRCGFERLHSLCVHQMQAIMDQGHVYVFLVRIEDESRFFFMMAVVLS